MKMVTHVRNSLRYRIDIISTLFLVLLISLCCFIFGGCGLPPEYNDFKGLTEEQEHEKFRKLSLDRQVDYHLIKMNFHPPDPRFAKDIAMRGEEAIPYLIERLEAESKDYRKNDILVIFEALHVNSVDLRERKEVIGKLEKVVDQMSDPDWKSMSQKRVQFIKTFTPKYLTEK